MMLSAVLLLLLAPEDQLVRWMDSIAQSYLTAREAGLAKLRTVEDAEARKTVVRAKVMELIGGLPEYSGPLNARVTGKVERPRYTIENVMFESLPQIWVTANLYRPKAPGRHPAILHPMGHWLEGKYAAQRIAANLAMKGFVVLVYDPLGQGERQQAFDNRMKASLAGPSTTDQHYMAGAQSILAGENFARYRIWDAKRSLDYLLSRPEVDGQRVGCTGCSGGGTLATYISALDPRIKVAAPACYINTWRLLFSGPTGDSEQSFPGFVSSGLDVTDYIELFAPKPWLIISTVADFFPIEGARHAYHEAQRFYRLYKAEDKVQWAVGPGGHGMPLEVREALYDWMIRWLKDGRGDYREEAVELAPNFELQVTSTGQVEGREIYQYILEQFNRRKSSGSREELVAHLKRLAETGAKGVRTVSETPGAEYRTVQLALENEPGLEIQATLYEPAQRSKPAVILVDGAGATASRLARQGSLVLTLAPRRPTVEQRNQRLAGDATTNTRAWVIGRNLAGMRAGDIVRGVDVLASRGAREIRGAARGIPGVWLLMAAAIEPRLQKIWLDRTPHSVRAALETPIHRNLHDVVIPGFALKWDYADLVKASQAVVWSNPTGWMGEVVPRVPGALYTSVDESADERFLAELLR
jgi:dienelactone hydrolase